MSTLCQTEAYSESSGLSLRGCRTSSFTWPAVPKCSTASHTAPLQAPHFSPGLTPASTGSGW